MFSLRLGQHKRRALALGMFALLTGCGTSWLLHVSSRSLDPRLKLLLGGGGNSAILLHGRTDALVVDTKFGDYSRRLRREVELELGRKVRRIVLTHAHLDHAGGLKLFPEVGVVLVHPRARQRLEAQGVRAPFVEVEGEVRLSLDGEEVRVLWMGNGHTDGDLVALVPGRKLLIAGDLLNEGIEPHVDPNYGGDLLTLRHTVARLMTLDFERVVPGHGELMTRAQAQLLADYLAALEAEVRQARGEGLTEDQVARKVTLPGYPLASLLGVVATREGNVRAMFQALGREGKTAP